MQLHVMNGGLTLILVLMPTLLCSCCPGEWHLLPPLLVQTWQANVNDLRRYRVFCSAHRDFWCDSIVAMTPVGLCAPGLSKLTQKLAIQTVSFSLSSWSPSPGPSQLLLLLAVLFSSDLSVAGVL